MKYKQILKENLKYYHQEYIALEKKYLNGELSFKEFKFETNATLGQIKKLNEELIRLKDII